MAIVRLNNKTSGLEKDLVKRINNVIASYNELEKHIRTAAKAGVAPKVNHLNRYEQAAKLIMHFEKTYNFKVKRV